MKQHGLTTGVMRMFNAIIFGGKKSGSRNQSPNQNLRFYETLKVMKRIIITALALLVAIAFAQPGTLKWKYETQDGVYSSPTIHDDTVYVGSFDGHIYALDARNGTLKWKYETQDAVQSSPTVHNDTLYVGSYDGHIYALNPTDGPRSPQAQAINSPVMITNATTTADDAMLNYEINLTNIGDQTIKYINLTTELYNPVGDPEPDSFTGRTTTDIREVGPINPNDTQTLNWNNLFTSQFGSCIQITTINITLADNTVKQIRNNDLPNIFTTPQQNDCSVDLQ